MVELQSCATLVNASALRDIEQEVQGDGANAIAEISAELQRERQKNAELMERISMLEAQIQERDRDYLLTHGHGNFSSAMERIFKKFKRQRIEPGSDTTDAGNIIKSIEMAYQMNHDTECLPPKDTNPEDRVVNWMSMDETQFLNFEKSKDGGSAADCDDTEDSDDEDDDYYEEDDIDTGHKFSEYGNISKASNELKKHHCEGGIDEGIHISCQGSSYCGLGETTFGGVSQVSNEDRKKYYLLPDTKHISNRREQRKSDRKETKKNGGYDTSTKAFTFEQEVCHKLSGSIPFHKKPPKLAFCPKEVKRMIESEALTLKNAQSHTIRKIIVFAPLGIRHGCEDMYELDFNHFIILRKGEPYVSPKNPGEHVLYDNPGVRRKVFYPNRQNPILCPVRILEEEKAMRPSHLSCPSCLFLCIKYGGRTRNLPQNEYVRQRMGRNKLKSFGPVMCQMAMLVHIRSGSFFFKALGITLLFMAGFPDNMVQRETKYRNLDLLQKYYRTDEDAQGEELFLSQPVACHTSQQVSPDSQQLTGKVNPAKSKGKKQTNSTSKPHNLQKPSILQPAPSTSTPVTQFGLMGYTSIHTRAIAAFQSMTSHTPVDTLQTSNPVVTSSGPDVSFPAQTPYPVFPPQPANAFMHMLYWPPPNTFPPCPYPTSYGYQSYPSTGNYMPIHPQPYYSQPSCNPFIPKMVENSRKNDMASEEADSDSDSSSSAEPKEILASCK